MTAAHHPGDWVFNFYERHRLVRPREPHLRARPSNVTPIEKATKHGRTKRKTTTKTKTASLGREVHSPGAPLKNAELFVDQMHFHRDRFLLVHHGGIFEYWNGACWPELDDRALRAELYRFFREAYWVDMKTEVPEEKPFDPTMRKVTDVVDALKGHVHLDRNVTAPAWLEHSGSSVPASETIALANGLLHIPTRTLHDATPRFYVNWSLPYPYDENAPPPTRWLQFLYELWADDNESIQALQEWFGYMLTGDTRQQKLFMLVGPKRSGKGTIARVLRGLVGPANVAGPTLSSLSTNFGLSPLIGKPVAIIADARLRSDDSTIVERLLSISGEDLLTIDRKYQDHWSGRLPTRFVLISNETPRLRDASGALASRFVILSMHRSFFGQEDQNLTDELLEELSGILQWSLVGLERLRSRGRFIQPDAALEVLRELEDLGSPMGAFVKDCLEVGPGYSAPVEAIWEAWKRWCESQGRDHPGTVQTFGRDLRAVVPGLKSTQPRASDRRYREYHGVRLAEGGP